MKVSHEFIVNPRKELFTYLLIEQASKLLLTIYSIDIIEPVKRLERQMPNVKRLSDFHETLPDGRPMSADHSAKVYGTYH